MNVTLWIFPADGLTDIAFNEIINISLLNTFLFFLSVAEIKCSATFFYPIRRQTHFGYTLIFYYNSAYWENSSLPVELQNRNFVSIVRTDNWMSLGHDWYFGVNTTRKIMDAKCQINFINLMFVRIIQNFREWRTRACACACVCARARAKNIYYTEETILPFSSLKFQVLFTSVSKVANAPSL